MLGGYLPTVKIGIEGSVAFVPNKRNAIINEMRK